MSSVTETSRQPLGNHAVLALGFRPFYLLAGVFSILALPLWLAIYAGLLQPGGYLTGVAWHSHEMVFGFAAAVIAGFLLTAVRNWTGQPTPTGAGLAGLALLWILGRVFVLTGPGLLATVADMAFLPALGVAVGLPIWRSKNARNYKILVVLSLLTTANVVYHLATLGVLQFALTRTATIAALDIITILMAVVGGRVIPAFTANAIPTSRPRQVPMLEVTSILSLILIFVAGILDYWYALPDWVWLTLLVIAVLTQNTALAVVEAPVDVAQSVASDAAGRLPVDSAVIGDACISNCRSCSACRRHSCTDTRCNQRIDAGDDDAQCTRPHRPGTDNRAVRNRCICIGAARGDNATVGGVRETGAVSGRGGAFRVAVVFGIRRVSFSLRTNAVPVTNRWKTGLGR